MVTFWKKWRRSTNNLGIAWFSKNSGMRPSCKCQDWSPHVLWMSTKLFTFGSPGLSCSVSLVNSHSSSPLEKRGNVGLYSPEMELAKLSHWAGIVMIAEDTLHLKWNVFHGWKVVSDSRSCGGLSVLVIWFIRSVLGESPGHPSLQRLRVVLAQSCSVQTDSCWWDWIGR